jgi:hypothetical protein
MHFHNRHTHSLLSTMHIQRFLGRYEFKVGSGGSGQTCEQEGNKTALVLAKDTMDGGKLVALKFFRDEAQVLRMMPQLPWVLEPLCLLLLIPHPPPLVCS